MAEFCYKCFCELCEDVPKHKLMITNHAELCEGCAENKPIVIGYKRDIYMIQIKRTLRRLVKPIVLLSLLSYIMIHLIKTKRNGKSNE